MSCFLQKYEKILGASSVLFTKNLGAPSVFYKNVEEFQEFQVLFLKCGKILDASSGVFTNNMEESLELLMPLFIKNVKESWKILVFFKKMWKNLGSLRCLLYEESEKILGLLVFFIKM